MFCLCKGCRFQNLVDLEVPIKPESNTSVMKVSGDPCNLPIVRPPWILKAVRGDKETTSKKDFLSFLGTPKYQIERRSERSTLKLICRVKGLNARWFREGKKINKTNPQPRYSFGKKGKMLVIKRLQKSDAGDFICKDNRTKKTVARFKVVVRGNNIMI